MKLTQDRVFSDDIEEGIRMIQNKTIIDVVIKVSNNKGLSLKTPFSEEFEVY